MMQFDGYRWEDRVPKPGRWKLDLALGVLAFAMLTLTLRPDLFARELPAQPQDMHTAQFAEPAALDADYPDTARDDSPSDAIAETPCSPVTS